MTEIKYPKSFSHIGVTVPEIHKAVEFYQSIMGWYVIMQPATVKKENDTAIGKMCIACRQTGSRLLWKFRKNFSLVCL